MALIRGRGRHWTGNWSREGTLRAAAGGAVLVLAGLAGLDRWQGHAWAYLVFLAGACSGYFLLDLAGVSVLKNRARWEGQSEHAGGGDAGEEECEGPDE